MAGEHRHPHACAGDLQIGQVQNLAAFIAQLDLFLGIAVFGIDIVQRHHVVRNRHRPLFRRWQQCVVPAHRQFARCSADMIKLPREHLDPFKPAAGNRLIG